MFKKFKDNFFQIKVVFFTAIFILTILIYDFIVTEENSVVILSIIVLMISLLFFMKCTQKIEITKYQQARFLNNWANLLCQFIVFIVGLSLFIIGIEYVV
jgi:Ca2+/Na+ antiporter